MGVLYSQEVINKQYLLGSPLTLFGINTGKAKCKGLLYIYKRGWTF